MSLLTYIINAYQNCKTNCEKHREFVRQLNKYGLTFDQFKNIQNVFIHYGINECCDESPSINEDESTFNNLKYVSGLGLKPGNENTWSIMMRAVKQKNARKVSPTISSETLGQKKVQQIG